MHLDIKLEFCLHDRILNQSSSQYHIAILPGDGSGPEVTAATVSVLEALLAKAPGFALTWSEHAVGAGEFLRSGIP